MWYAVPNVIRITVTLLWLAQQCNVLVITSVKLSVISFQNWGLNIQ